MYKKNKKGNNPEKEFGNPENNPDRKDIKKIALVIPDDKIFYDAYYFKKLNSGIKSRAYERGYKVKTFQQHEILDIEKQLETNGYILIAPPMDSKLVHDLEKENIPCVLINQRSKKISWVDVDNFTATKEMINYLIKKGHTRICIIAGKKQAQNSTERVRGYIQALKENSLEYNEEYVLYGEFSEEEAFKQMKQFISKELPFTAVFACNDLMAVGAILTLNTCNLKVPDDVSVIGFDDIDVSSYYMPSITTYRQPLSEMGMSAVDILIGQIKNRKKEHKEKVFKGRFILRESTGEKGM